MTYLLNTLSSWQHRTKTRRVILATAQPTGHSKKVSLYFAERLAMTSNAKDNRDVYPRGVIWFILILRCTISTGIIYMKCASPTQSYPPPPPKKRAIELLSTFNVLYWLAFVHTISSTFSSQLIFHCWEITGA